jgi:hypothetical protein
MPAQRRSRRSTAGQHPGRQAPAASRPTPAVRRRSQARGIGRSRSNQAPGQLTAATDEQASGEQTASIAGNAPAATQAVRGDGQPLELTSWQREALLELDLGIVRRCRSLPRLRELCRERGLPTGGTCSALRGRVEDWHFRAAPSGPRSLSPAPLSDEPGRPLRVVCTGGPGGGKSTAIPDLAKTLRECGIAVGTVEEQATAMFAAAGTSAIAVEPGFQPALLRQQLAQEDAGRR